MTKKITRSRAIFLMLMLVVVLGTIFMILTGNRYIEYDYVIMLTFAVNILFFVYMLMISIYEHPFSLNMMFWLFNLIFLGVAPLLQYLTDIYAWNLNPHENEVLKANVLILIWSVSYLGGSRIVLKKKNDLPKKKTDLPIQYTIKTNTLNFLVMASVMITVYYLLTVGLNNLIYRETSGVSGLSSIATLLTEHGFKNTVLFTAIFCAVAAKQQGKIDIRTVIAIVCLFISCFPTGIPRNMMASFYAGLIIIMFDKTRKGRWFALAIFGGLILIFPALNVFRYVAGSNTNIFSAILSAFGETYLEGHYDAHQMLISTQRYVEQFGFKFFSQMLGALFFFVPRSIWANKPVGTGHTVISELRQYYFTNVSAPVVAECYIGFGIIGIVIGGILLSKAVKKIDDIYWNEANELCAIRLIYPCAIFMFFFMLRGDLLSSWAYTFAQIVVGMALCKLVIKRN